jgi:hypothetical protein
MFWLKESSSGQLLKHVWGTSSESAHFWDPKMFIKTPVECTQLHFNHLNKMFIKTPIECTQLHFNHLNKMFIKTPIECTQLHFNHLNKMFIKTPIKCIQLHFNHLNILGFQKCALFFYVPHTWFNNWPDDDSLSQNISPL